MDQTEITNYIVETFAGVESESAMGYVFFFYGADHKLPFATLAIEDNEYDRASQLDREGVYRLNIGVSPNTYRAMFGPPPAPPGASGVVDTGHDFTVLDELMPHPVYAPQSWICVLNPGAITFERVKPLLQEAYEIAVKREARRQSVANQSDSG